MTGDNFALNVSRFAIGALLILFITKIAVSDTQTLPSPSKILIQKEKIDFPYLVEHS